MRKRMMIVALLSLLVLVMAACAAPAAPAADTGGDAAAADSGEAAMEQFRVAIVMPSTITDLAWSQAMYDGLVAVQSRNGRRGCHGDRLLREHVQRGRRGRGHPRLCGRRL